MASDLTTPLIAAGLPVPEEVERYKRGGFQMPWEVKQAADAALAACIAQTVELVRETDSAHNLADQYGKRARDAKAERDRLREAVIRLYCAAFWEPDRKVDAEQLWEDVRDAARLEPGRSPAKIRLDADKEPSHD